MEILNITNNCYFPVDFSINVIIPTENLKIDWDAPRYV